MQSQEGFPDYPTTRTLSRRSFLALAGSTTSLVLLAACGSPAAPPAAPQAPSAPQPASTPAAAAAAPQPAATAASVARAEPKGRLVYGWHTTISPAWFDPQENTPVITPYNFQYCLHDALVKHMPGRTFA